MDTGRDISIDMTTDELSTMKREPDVEGLSLSAAALAALESAAPNPGGVPAHWFTRSMGVARELLTWAEAGEARWRSVNPKKAALFRSATKQVRFGLWKVGAGPTP
jgi:hypothetical protein